MPDDDKNKKPAKNEKPAPDPEEGWTDEEKAEWASSEKFRKRHASEVADSIFDRLFNEVEGGAVTDPDGGEEETPPSGGKGGEGSGGAAVPWFERKLFAGKTKPK